MQRNVITGDGEARRRGLNATFGFHLGARVTRGHEPYLGFFSRRARVVGAVYPTHSVTSPAVQHVVSQYQLLFQTTFAPTFHSESPSERTT